MTKVREEAFKKTRSGFMHVINELVYAQKMIQGRLIEASHQRSHQMVSEKTPVMSGAAWWLASLLVETPSGNFTTGDEDIEKVIKVIQADREADKAKKEKEEPLVKRKKKKSRSQPATGYRSLRPRPRKRGRYRLNLSRGEKGSWKTTCETREEGETVTAGKEAKTGGRPGKNPPRTAKAEVG